MVIAHARHMGTCKREQVPFLLSQVCLTGVIGTTLKPSSDTIPGPV